jgi:hypothetical protein
MDAHRGSTTEISRGQRGTPKGHWWMLDEHLLSLYHWWCMGIKVQLQAHGPTMCGCSSSIRYLCTIRGMRALRCSHKQTLMELVDACRASTILVGVEGCVIVSGWSWNRLADARRASIILVPSGVCRHRGAVASTWSCNLWMLVEHLLSLWT